MPGFFNSLAGREGEIRIEMLGVLVGTIQSWSLTRRGDVGPKEGLYDLHAVLSYLNPHLWSDGEYEKTITVRVGREKIRLEQAEGYGSSLDGRRALRMEGVRLCPL